MLKILSNCSEYQKSVVATSLLVLSGFLGIAIANSTNLSFSSHGIEITQTAIANQAQLEQALYLIELQQSQIKAIKETAIAVEKRTDGNVGGQIVDKLTQTELLFQPDSVREIEQTIERSQAVLEVNN